MGASEGLQRASRGLRKGEGGLSKVRKVLEKSF